MEGNTPSGDLRGPKDNDVIPIDASQQKAASIIQDVYRRYRTRRELQGLGIGASRQWVQATTETEQNDEQRDSTEENTDAKTQARRNWNHAVDVARRAGSADTIHDEYTQGTESDGPSVGEQTAKMMDLQYFLEMVDVKHRHGSNLRAYHSYWKTSPSNQNFFYWLDHGAGKDLELPQCSRDRLEKEQVRYLSREERMNYLVSIDDDGLFRWAKNGELVSTDSTRFKDSFQGVVPIEDDVLQFGGHSETGMPVARSSSSSSPSSSEDSAAHSSEGEVDRYETEDYRVAKRVRKLAHASPGTLLKRIKGKKKRHDMWIFVADTSFRIYIGIKESGAFQHSSFLRGARIAAAGLIKIGRGHLRSLAPLSGHYRPPAANFRKFVHALRDKGVNMSQISLTKSYAILGGIQGYTFAKQNMRDLHEKADEIKRTTLQKEPEERRSQGARKTEHTRYLENAKN